jgi:hypothetical protein
MCQGCFDEAGQPRIKHPSVVVAAMAARGLDPFGALHIVIEDWNVEDSHIEHVLAADDIKPEEFAWACFFRVLTVEQRVSALALADHYWDLNDPDIEVPLDVAAKLLVVGADSSPVRLA